jgi:DNA-binding LacI/PurR family transcriptional regulator
MYRIPEDISLTGIDGTSLALYSVPSITTMANDPLVLADYTVKMLLELMKGKSKGKIMQIEPHIIVGESTAKTNGVVTDAIS